MKIIIAGSRTFADEALLFRKLDKLTAKLKNAVIVTNGNKGPDKMILKWAWMRGFVAHIYHGEPAEKMIEAGSKALIAFWNGKNDEVAHLITLATKAGLKIKVIRV